MRHYEGQSEWSNYVYYVELNSAEKYFTHDVIDVQDVTAFEDYQLRQHIYCNSFGKEAFNEAYKKSTGALSETLRQASRKKR